MNCPKCNEDIISMSVHWCNEKKYSKTPRDRGQSDYYYGRDKNPHYYNIKGDTITDLTPKERGEYHAGYDEYERDDIRKEWD